MKKYFFIMFILGSIVSLFSRLEAQGIASGPDAGEIYFILDAGLSGYNIYRSTDHGETAALINSENWNPYLYADKSPGCIYTVSSYNHLYFSDNFGYPGTWLQRQGNYAYNMFSGVHEGFIYSGLSKHSEDYGETWIDHQINGLPEIYGLQSITGDSDGDLMYTLIWDQSGIYYLFGSNNNFDDCFIIDTINTSETPLQELVRGTNPGELYSHRLQMFNNDKMWIHFSNDYGHTWDLQNILYASPAESSLEWDISVSYMTGGIDGGECYVQLTAIWGMYDKGHAYILHSTDYGKTFQVNHPVAWGGSQPVHTNFSAPQSEGTALFTVEWCNYSIGEDLVYSWDFENDGIIDSNEESPVFTYEEPGTYSVKLHLSGEYEDSLVREDYIRVYPPPPMPQGLSAEVINDDVFLNWQQVNSPDLIGYKVYRDTVLLTPEPISDTSFAEYKLPNGSYEYCVSAVYPYGESEQSCVQADITVGVEDFLEDAFYIFSNPASRGFGIVFPGSFQLRIFDISGKEVFSKTNCWDREEIASGNLKQGVYVFVIDDGVRRISRKVALY